MKFYFLTHKNMADTFKNALKTGAIIAGLATNPALADTPNSATHVAVSGESIDFKSKIASIDKQIVQIQTKIDLLLQKGNLSEADQFRYLTLDEEIEKLTAEKLVIVDDQNENKKEKVAIKTNTEKQLDNSIKEHTEQLSIAEKKLAALDRVSNILTEQKSQ